MEVMRIILEGVKMNLTELEKDVIVAIAESEYADSPKDWIWSWAIDYETKITRTGQISGVVSSLVKKGLAKCFGERKDSMIRLTDTGVKAYDEIKGN